MDRFFIRHREHANSGVRRISFPVESYLFIVYLTTLPVGQTAATVSNDKLVYD